MKRARKTASPAEVAAKNKRYVAGLVRRFSEQTIRAMLKCLSKEEEPYAAARLAELDLAQKPLTDIIDQFGWFGFRFEVKQLSGDSYRVKFGESAGLCGSGGNFVLTRNPASDFVVTDGEIWIA
jgi:hypothetical protein